MNLGLAKTIQKPFTEAILSVTKTLKKERFGIITQIEVTATMKEKYSEKNRKRIIDG